MSIQIFHWESNEIPRRADGYFNATAMCKAGGKRWNNWWRQPATQELIQALSAAAHIRATELVQSVSGGTAHLQGTWIHAESSGPDQTRTRESCSEQACDVKCTNSLALNHSSDSMEEGIVTPLHLLALLIASIAIFPIADMASRTFLPSCYVSPESHSFNLLCSRHK